jgi:hypothetical protein
MSIAKPIDPWAIRYPETTLPEIDYTYDRVTAREKAKIVGLWRWGLCTEYLSERFGLREETINKYLREAGVTGRRAA